MSLFLWKKAFMFCLGGDADTCLLPVTQRKMDSEMHTFISLCFALMEHVWSIFRA